LIERLKELIKERALKVSDKPIFKLSSGQMSTYYMDLRTVTLDPEGGYIIGNVVFEMIKDKNPDAVGGLTLGAEQIEGNVKPGDKVFIVEDVVTTAGSSLKAAKVAQDFGLEILGLISFQFLKFQNFLISRMFYKPVGYKGYNTN